MQIIPELRPFYPWHRPDVPVANIFSPDQVRPEPLFILAEFPNPLGYQSQVHKIGIDYPQAPLVLGGAYRGPINQVVTTFLSNSLLEEAASAFVHRLMSALIQKVKAHGVSWKARQTSIRQREPSSR